MKAPPAAGAKIWISKALPGFPNFYVADSLEINGLAFCISLEFPWISKDFLGGFAGFQWLGGEKIWKMRFSTPGSPRGGPFPPLPDSIVASSSFVKLLFLIIRMPERGRAPTAGIPTVSSRANRRVGEADPARKLLDRVRNSAPFVSHGDVEAGRDGGRAANARVDDETVGAATTLVGFVVKRARFRWRAARATARSRLGERHGADANEA